MDALEMLGPVMQILAGMIWVIAVIVVFMIVCRWIIYVKAGQPGWAAIVPIYSTLVFLKVAGRPWWLIFMFLLPLIPIVGAIALLVVLIYVIHGLSKNFGQGVGFTVGLVLLGIVFFPILAFGKAKYVGE